MHGLIWTAMIAQAVLGAAPLPEEISEARRWVSARMEGSAEQNVPRAGALEVLSNNDPVQRNARGGRPLRIRDKEYTKGLYCHAVSKVIVHLPGPGKTLEALVGVDSNDQTSGGRGSVVFSVNVAGKEAWRSEVLREGMPAVPVSVALQGAPEFLLEVGDSGDGIGCDQADWAEARVILEDGTSHWLGEFILEQSHRKPYGSDPFFSFQLGDRPSSEFLSSWKIQRNQRKLDEQRNEHTILYTDPSSGLEVRCIAVAYQDYPTVEWTLHFKNGGSSDSPMLSEILSIDTGFDRGSGSEFVLHRNKGDNCTADSYEPVDEILKPNTDRQIANTGGRPTQIEFPYFNIEAGPSGQEGLIFVVSWAGQWKASFTRDASSGLRLKAGQELTHFVLRAGEEVRTPMIVLQFWRGDRLHAQNVWRSWMIDHVLPRPGGKLPPVPQLAACSSHQFGEMIHANRDNQIFFADQYLARGIKLDYWWMDAGWYINQTGWPNTGTWEVDTTRFPGGLRAITDHVHSKGVKSLVWFEPERVTAGTWLAENHPEWILGGKGGGLLNLGNPETRLWLTDHVDRLLNEQGIDLYRQDFNMDPLGFWRGNDAEDRQGITEIRHVEGYFAYWDELRRRHPDMLIDSCASGGRRNDLETLRRAVPLLRSDYIMEPVGNQCHTYALSSWFPFYGTGTSKTDTYLIRSTLCPHFIACWDMRDDHLDYDRLSRIMAQWKEMAPFFMGDYYPLTDYTLSEDQWIAWQFHAPDKDSGMVQVFRRDDSIYESARMPLKGLLAQARYLVTNVDEEGAVTLSGQDLMEKGLPVSLRERPAAGIILYRRVE